MPSFSGLPDADAPSVNLGNGFQCKRYYMTKICQPESHWSRTQALRTFDPVTRVLILPWARAGALQTAYHSWMSVDREPLAG